MMSYQALTDIGYQQLGEKRRRANFSFRNLQNILATAAASLKASGWGESVPDEMLERAGTSLDDQHLAFEIVVYWLGYTDEIKKSYEVLESMIQVGYEGLSEADKKYVQDVLVPWIERMKRAEDFIPSGGCF